MLACNLAPDETPLVRIVLAVALARGTSRVSPASKHKAKRVQPGY